MKRLLPLGTGVMALGIEAFVFLSLMELPPVGKGGSDIIWGLPFFGLIVLGLAVPGLRIAIGAMRDPHGNRGVALAGLLANSLGLAVPIVLLLSGIVRAVVS